MGWCLNSESVREPRHLTFREADGCRAYYRQSTRQRSSLGYRLRVIGSQFAMRSAKRPRFITTVERGRLPIRLRRDFRLHLITARQAGRRDEKLDRFNRSSLISVLKRWRILIFFFPRCGRNCCARCSLIRAARCMSASWPAAVTSPCPRSKRNWQISSMPISCAADRTAFTFFIAQTGSTPCLSISSDW
jgi:hypothetical protein